MAEPQNTTGEPVASITRHYAPIVADNEEDAVPEQPKADAAEEHVEEPKETTEAEVETEEKEPETTEKVQRLQNPQRLQILRNQPMLPKKRLLQFRMQQQRQAAKM